jgi:(2R)-sulfolactate sulfo-lyase subunit alpha
MLPLTSSLETTVTKEIRVSVPQLLVHNNDDNVGVVVVEGLTAGTDMLCVITHDNSDFRLTAKADIPIGHKVALKDLSAGDTMMKYGEDIGKIIADVKVGEHVHTHNCKTKRW